MRLSRRQAYGAAGQTLDCSDGVSAISSRRYKCSEPLESGGGRASGGGGEQRKPLSFVVAFAREAGAFLAAANRAASAGRTGTALLAAERPALSVRRTCRGYAGRATPPDPDRASALRSSYQSQRDTEKADRYFVYGWRTPYGFEIPPYAVPPNTMDLYTNRVDALDSAWQPTSGTAASSLRVTVGGHAVRLSPTGAFVLGRRACGKSVVATDRAGGRTGLRLRACRRRS